ncbi:hypothetical protein [Streptomyces sp. NPDC006274]|uniref:hypothetical protein n=1 Tax=unclassified Streptomyces TaxID=2593676 RepID=UPI0033B864E1
MQPQQPYQPPAPPPPPAPPTAPARGRGPLVTALLVGLLAGGAGVGAAWALTGGTSGGGDAAADARGACDALAGFDESKYLAEGNEGLVALNRWHGAVTLSTAAAAGDSSYKPLADALRRAADRHQRDIEFNAEVMKDLTKARDLCADL